MGVEGNDVVIISKIKEREREGERAREKEHILKVTKSWGSAFKNENE